MKLKKNLNGDAIVWIRLFIQVYTKWFLTVQRSFWDKDGSIVFENKLLGKGSWCTPRGI